MTARTLENAIFNALFSHGSMNACQLSLSIGYPLSASDEYDARFFNAIDNLESRGWLHSKPISSLIPDADDSDPYMGKIYRAGPDETLGDLLKEMYHETVDKVKKYFMR
jgi:hypothetical protein